MLQSKALLISLFGVLLIGLLFVSFFYLSGPTSPSDYDSHVVDLITDTSAISVFRNNLSNDSIPHYKYKRIEDSLQRVQHSRELGAKGFGTGISAGPIGVRKLWLDGSKSNKKNASTYFTLNGYTLEEGYNKFYIYEGKYYLLYTVWDKKDKYRNITKGHQEYKEIPVRYSANDKAILIPISNKNYKFLYGTIIFLWVILVFFFSYLFIGLPFQVLLSISKGKAFLKENINALKIISGALVLVGLVRMFVNPLLRIAFRNYVPPEFELPSFYTYFSNNLKFFILALVVFLIMRAFQKGYQLQKEQELTI